MNPVRELEQIAIEIVRRHVSSSGTVVDMSAGHDPDYRVDYADGRTGIGEIGWHEDPRWRALWEETLKRGTIPQVVDLSAGSGLWSVGLTLDARIWQIYKLLPSLVTDLLAAGESDLEIYNDWPPGALADRARRLGIKHLSQVEAAGDRVIFLPPGAGGIVPSDPNAITEWLNDVLVNDPDYQDTTQKLLSRAADERHIFLLAGSATPWGVEELLRRLDIGLPSEAPSVPSEITHVWAVSSFTTPLGALWERDRGWTTIDART